MEISFKNVSTPGALEFSKFLENSLLVSKATGECSQDRYTCHCERSGIE